MTRGPQSSVVALRKCIYMTRGPQSDVVALWKQVTRGPQSCVVALTKQMTRGPQSGVVALRKEGIVLECPYPTRKDIKQKKKQINTEKRPCNLQICDFVILSTPRPIGAKNIFFHVARLFWS